MLTVRRCSAGFMLNREMSHGSETSETMRGDTHVTDLQPLTRNDRR